MITRFNSSTGEPIQLRSLPGGKGNWELLPGSELLEGKGDHFSVTQHSISQPQVHAAVRKFDFHKDDSVILTEPADWLRLEVVLDGALSITDRKGNDRELLPGQYQLTDLPVFRASFRKGKTCTYFVAYYSPHLKTELQLNEFWEPVAPRHFPLSMQEIVSGILHNPYEAGIRAFYYENRVRDLLFKHISSPPVSLPGNLTRAQVASMYAIDGYMAGHLDEKITLKELARKAGVNFVTLKKLFEQVFGLNPTNRLRLLRMDKAKILLESTDKPLKDVFESVGYETLAGFITEFRKRFGETPNQWRKNRQGRF